MKIILFFIIFASFSAFAQTPEEAARRLEALQNPSPEVNCDKHLITPEEALAELNSSSKTFLGRKNLPGHDQNYTCVYKTSKAYVLYHNCMGSKREYNALDFEVIPFDGNIIGFSMENNNIGLPSTLKRSQYNMNWAVSFQLSNPPGGNLSIDQLHTYLSSNSLLGSCFVGGTYKAQDMKQEAQCSERIKNADTAQWVQKATAFWREPGDDWYRAISESRRRMTSF